MCHRLTYVCLILSLPSISLCALGTWRRAHRLDIQGIHYKLGEMMPVIPSPLDCIAEAEVDFVVLSRYYLMSTPNSNLPIDSCQPCCVPIFYLKMTFLHKDNISVSILLGA